MSGSWYDYDEYLKPHHLQGKRLLVTIERVAEIEVGYGKQKKTKPVLFFRGKKKYLFMDSANRREALIAIYGEDKANCVGKQIALAPGKYKNEPVIDILPPTAMGSQVTAIADPMNKVWDWASKHQIEAGTVAAIITECANDPSRALDVLINRFELQAAQEIAMATMTTYESILLQTNRLTAELQHPVNDEHRIALIGALARARIMLEQLKKMPIIEGAAVPVEAAARNGQSCH